MVVIPNRMRLVLVLVVITAVGIVAGGFTGKTIAENSLTSSSSAPTDSKKDLLTDYTRLVSSDDPSPQASVNSTGTAPAQQEPPQIFEAPKAEGSSIHETEQQSFSSSSPSSEGTTPLTNATGPISALTSHSPPLYQVSRQVGASLTIEEGLIGDVNDDGSVNEIDLVQVSRSFDTRPGQPTLLDVNGDGRVDIFDLATVAAHQGDETPV